ncbi:MAG: biotin/lipoyl-binding protein [Proteobacteria bacterium]|nr:biotin/lipoyl-binding protein [Pseudomonadota bacterium]
MASTLRLTLNGEEHELEVEERDDGLHVRLADTWYPVGLERIGETAHYSLLLDKVPYEVFAVEGPQGYHVVIGSRMYAIAAPAPGRGRHAGDPVDVDALAEGEEWVLTSPMAGVIQEVLVKADDEVEAGQVVMVIEASKTPINVIKQAFAAVQSHPVVLSMLNKYRGPKGSNAYGYGYYAP